MSTSKFGVNLYSMFEPFQNAPQHLEDLEKFEKQCEEAGFIEAAEYVFEWRVRMQYHIEREWTE